MRVTEALRLAGLIDTTAPWFTDTARDRGTALHAAIALDLVGDLDESTVDPSVAPRLDAFRRWRAEIAPEVIAIEADVTHQIYRYAGRIDLVARVHGRLCVIDYKPSPAPWHPIQLAAYAAAWKSSRSGAVPERRVLYLATDGKYTFPGITSGFESDYAVFQSALTIARWRQVHG